MTPAGSWTVDGAVVISKVSISHKRLQIRSKRCFLSPGPDGYELLPSERELTIDIERGSQSMTVDSVHELLHHIFLTAQDRASDFVPAYWKPCFGAQTTTAPACRFSPSIAPLFKFAPSVQTAEPASDPTKISATDLPRKSEMGSLRPTFVYAPDLSILRRRAESSFKESLYSRSLSINPDALRILRLFLHSDTA